MGLHKGGLTYAIDVSHGARESILFDVISDQRIPVAALCPGDTASVNFRVRLTLPAKNMLLTKLTCFFEPSKLGELQGAQPWTQPQHVMSADVFLSTGPTNACGRRTEVYVR
jgi:hypothetical protein